MLTEKIKVTPQQRANALEALNVMWPSVPEGNVTSRLNVWRAVESPKKPPSCGTVACFGGWTEWWPSFRQQLGVKQGHEPSWRKISELFGPWQHSHISDLFNPRECHDADIGFSGTDHALVANRLIWLIANSEVVG
ncbi:hypothetical protein D9M72_181570 [compost metagenome]